MRFYKIFLNFAFIINQFLAVLSFQSSHPKSQCFVDSISRLNWANDDESYEGLDDSYGLLDLEKAITQPTTLYNAITIDNSKDNSPLIKFGRKKNKKESLSPAENIIDLEGEDSWMVEICDSIEQRVGRPIWSNKSVQQIKQEFRKNQALRAMKMPESVRKLIEEVFIEKSIKMNEYQSKNKLAVLEYRKWLMEQKQKQANSKVKKSPLQIAKLEVSKRWLKCPPSMSDPSVKPVVVHDELTSPPNGYTIGSNAKTVTMASPNYFFNSAPQSLITSSMTLWDKTRTEYIQIQSPRGVRFNSQSIGTDASAAKSQSLLSSKESVTIDDVEMFIASNVNKQDYFVLL